MHRQAWGSTEAVWICYRHAREPESCKMKPQSENDLKNAFLNCLNKLSWSQRMKDERRRVLDVYEKKQMEHLSERYTGELERLEKQLQKKQQEERNLAAMMRKSGVCASQHNRKKLLIKELQGLECERRQVLKEFRLPEPFFSLKNFIRQWKIHGETEAFPEDFFAESVGHCTVNSGSAVIFHFHCGLKLQESLKKTEVC